MSCRSSIHTALALVFAALFLQLSGCDEGLSPSGGPGSSPGIAGTVRVVGPWAPIDSIIDLRVAAFRVYPPENILFELLQGRAVFSEALTTGAEVQEYRIEGEDLQGVFEYVVVAQQYGPKLEQDWRVVGVYAVSGDQTRPSSVDLANGTYVAGIDITVDFQNLPPQPF